MKYVMLIIFLFFISCKNEIKTVKKPETKIAAETQVEGEVEIDKSVTRMWNNYIAANPKFKDDEIPETDFFDNSEKEAHRFSDLIVNGKKKASSGLYSLYKQYGVALPQVGTKIIVTDYNGKAQAIIETKKVDTIPFNQVTSAYAELDMGTDVEPLKKWKKAHWDFFEDFLKESGQEPTEDMLVVREWFETIWTKNQRNLNQTK